MPKFPDWFKHSAISIAIFCVILIALYVLSEYRDILEIEPNQWYGRVRAILLTLAAVLGLPFLIWRTVIADRQNQINRESHHAELLIRSIELLGSTRTGENGTLVPAIETRIGAIFALERLSKASQADYGNIVETLSAYVREQCGRPSDFDYPGDDPDEEGILIHEKMVRIRRWCEALWKWTADIRKESLANREDVAAALLVLSRRKDGRQWQEPRGFRETTPSLSEANLQGANLSVTTSGLFDSAGTSRARVEGARLDGFTLAESSLVHPQIQHKLTESRAAPKSLIGVSVLALSIDNLDLFPVFNGAVLSFAHMNNAKCRNSRFRGATLVNANLRCADLTGARFGAANASNARLHGADLTQAEFLGALLEGTQFVGANLSDAQFQYGHLQEANLEGALLARTNFTGALNLKFEAVEKAFGTHETILPDGVPLPSHWSDEATAIENWQAFRVANGLCDSNQGR